MNYFFFYPPGGQYIRGEDRCQVAVSDLAATSMRPPLDLAYMAAMARQAGHRVWIRDYPAEGKSWQDYIRDLQDCKPDVLVMSAISSSFADDMQAFAVAREINPAILTLAKGAPFLEGVEEVMTRHPELDVIIRGEYKPIFQEFVRTGIEDCRGIVYRRADQIVINPPMPLTYALDDFPFPCRALVANERYVRPDTGEPQTTIQAAEGCPYHCTYCLAYQLDGHRIKRRSPESIVAEMECCVTQHNIRNFFFRADTFTANAAWVKALCTQILKSPISGQISWVANSRVDTLDAERLQWMKAAGCWLVALGVELGYDEGLKRIRKGTTCSQAETAMSLLRQAGIKSYGFFMLGFPWERKTEVMQTIEFAKQLRCDFYEFSIFVPYPGTEIYKEMRRNGIAVPDMQNHHHARAGAGTPHLTAEELMQLRKLALRTVYLRPAYLFDRLREMAKDRRAAVNYCRYGMKLLRNII